MKRKNEHFVSKHKIWIIIIALVIIIIIALISMQIQRGGEKITVENTIRTYLDALNSYDVDAGWELMSPTFREDVGYTGYEMYMHNYWEAGEHHVEIQEITDKTFLTWEILRTWEFTMNWQLTNTTGTYIEEVIFQVERVEGEWKILNWGYPE